MKKRIFSFLIVFMALFMINKMSVSAGKVCNYGLRENDDPNTWTQQLQFEVESWNKVYINGPNSPYINPGYSISKVENEKYDYEGKYNAVNYLRIYLSLYPNETVYNNLNGECPKIIRYRQSFESGWTNTYHLIIYNDDLDKATEDEIFMGINFDGETQEGIFIEESQKATKTDDLVDNYGCTTYSSSLDEIKKTVSASDSKSCDNNPEFNYKYQEISQICESYRSTALYATDDGDKIIAKSCQKACTRLKDDIAGICNAAPDGGYCGSLGNKVVNWIFRIVRIVRYAVPVLLILLSILDYIKALAADNEDEMKKVTSRFVHRLIAAALIFIVPFILDFILRIFNIPGLNASNPFCAK